MNKLYLAVPCILAVLLCGGCSDDKCVQCPNTLYLEQTSPENVIHNLEVSYLERDIDQYIKLLAPEFIFKVQPVDVAAYGEFFTRDQDSAGTEALFTSPLVSNIRILLTYGAAIDSIEAGFPPGTKKIRVQPTFLEVDETTGITWQVDGDIQDMFFRRGIAENGENSAYWFLIEWRDIPGGGTAPRAGTLDPGGTTWGRIKARYGN